MNKKNQKLTTRSQVAIELICIGGALLIWLLLLVLGGQLTEVFFFILIAYHVIGGLLNRDLAKNIGGAIVFAPVYVGRKIAIYIQAIKVEDNFKNLTTDDLVDINHYILDILKEHPNQKDKPMTIAMFGCATYGELEAFNERIIAEYNNRKK